MNMLLDYLPEQVEIQGHYFEIRTDFRIGIKFELLMQDNSFKDEEKLLIALNLFYPDVIVKDEKTGEERSMKVEQIVGMKEAIESILWIYRCGKKENKVKRDPTGDEDQKSDSSYTKLIYSYEHDDQYFYSAFMEQYGIDLQDQDLHWWKFKALINGLNEKTQISKIMGYRAIKISDEMSDSQQKFYRDMKRIYALPDNRTEKEKEDEFNDSLSSMF